MLLPTSTLSTSCQKTIMGILTDNEANSNTSSITELTKSTFTENPDYNKVNKNFDYSKSYDAWIYEGNKEDKIVGYKMFQSYPYDKPQFKIGDYIHWNYNHKELSTWLLTSLDTQYLYNVTGRMLECNNSLRWKDKNGNINCYPCVIKDAMTYTNFKWGNSGLVQSGGDIVVLVQRNDKTSTIDINDRFIFTGVAFKVKQKFNELNPDYLELYMMKVPELEGDNLKENIAINDTENVKETGEIRILPNINEILVGDTQSFSVYKYNNSIKLTNAFDITVLNVPEECYELNIIDGNNFKIKNNKQYTKNPMEITCKDIDNEEIKSIQAWLGGNW